jgi:hypothetical protein
MSEHVVREATTYTTHNKQPYPQQDFNVQFQQSDSHRPMPQIAWSLESAMFILFNIQGYYKRNKHFQCYQNH